MFIKRTRPFPGRFFMVSCLFLGLGMLYGQKKVTRVFDAESLTKIQVNAERIFQVELQSEPTDQIEAEVAIEGEYQSELTVSAKRMGSTLVLSGVFLPTFKDPNDKLSAHKVVSVGIKLRVPEQLAVEISGAATRVTASGFYEDLDIDTGKGPVVLQKASGFIKVRTMSGVITAKEASGVIEATSSYGSVFQGTTRDGNSVFTLESLSGDIYVNKEE